MSVPLSKDGPAMPDSASLRARDNDAHNGSTLLRERCLNLFAKHGEKIGTDFAEAGARLLAGVGQ